jgi:uncharacterized protein (TIGR00297 family)
VNQIVIGCVFALVIAAVSWRSRLLTPGGAAVQFVLGWLLLGLGGWQWTLPMLVFFFTSSLISRTAKKKRAMVERQYAKTGSRDSWQVLANGGAGGLLVILWFLTGWEATYVGFLAAGAAAAADTWGTEIGVLSSGNPLMITSFRPVDAGRSGAVSLLGTASGFCGALLVVCSGLPWMPAPYRGPAIFSAMMGGMAGTLADSLLGATVQAQFICTLCGRITEKSVHCGEDTRAHTGFPWMQNDLVNFLCTIAGTVVGWMTFHVVTHLVWNE